MVYAGAELEDQHTLAFYSFKSGRTIHVLTKDKPKPLRVPKPLSDADMQRFLSAMEEYGHKNFVQVFINVILYVLLGAIDENVILLIILL